MASPEVLDLEALCEPIPGDVPAGQYLRGDTELSTYFNHVRDARKTASDAERAQIDYTMLSAEEREYEPRPDLPDWDSVAAEALKILQQYSKDLWVTAWLIEALTRKHGFAGLRDGLRLLYEYCDRFWDNLYPRPDETDGWDHTLSQVIALNDLLLGPLDRVPLTPTTGAVDALTSADYKDAARFEGRPEKAQREAEGGVTLETFDRVAAETSAEFYQQLVEDLDAAAAQVERLSDLWDQKFDETELPGEAPSLSRVAASLEECRHRVHSFAKQHLEAQQGDEPGDGGDDSPDGPGKKLSTSVDSREEAFQALRKIAEFFRKTEPHSPLSYALEQVVRWGGMSLPQLMRELINDDSTRRELFRRTGIGDDENAD